MGTTEIPGSSMVAMLPDEVTIVCKEESPTTTEDSEYDSDY